jgi:RNA polymerase sigma factor (sigma-70 family)
VEYSLELIKQAKAGDRDAFSKLYEKVYQDMYRFALYTLKNNHDAEDVVSEAVIAAFEGIRGLRKVEAFKGWIFRILSIKCKNRLKQYIDKTEELPDNLMETARDFGEEFDIKVAFGNLSDEERLIVSMHIFGDYTSKEIGKILYMKSGTVRSKYSRALTKMEEHLCMERR